MTDQQTLAQPPQTPQTPQAPPSPPVAPPADPAPRRTVGLRLLLGSVAGAFVLGTLVGGGFGALIGYVAHPDAPERPTFEQQDLPSRPGFGAEQLPEGQSTS